MVEAFVDWITPSRGVDDIRDNKPGDITPAHIQEPYGGCDEAHRYPDTPGYELCERLGRLAGQ